MVRAHKTVGNGDETTGILGGKGKIYYSGLILGNFGETQLKFGKMVLRTLILC